VKHDIQSSRVVANDFINGLFSSLARYVDSIGAWAFPDIALGLHTHLMRLLPLSVFLAVNSNVGRSDAAFLNLPEQQIMKYCLSHSSQKVSELFKTPDLFVFPVEALKRAVVTEVPIEALIEFAGCFEAIAEVYGLEVDGAPLPETLGPFVAFTVFIGKQPGVVSACRYVQHDVADLAASEARVLDGRLRGAIAHLLKFCAVIDELLRGQ
jgi:hypothetical protein